MFSIALALVFGFALLLVLAAGLGMFLVGYSEKRRGAPAVPAPARGPSTSSDVTLYLRAQEGADEGLFGGHPIGARSGLLDADSLQGVCRALAAEIATIRDAAVVYAAPQFYAPFDDGRGGPHYRLRVRTRRPLGTITSPISRDALRGSLLQMSELTAEDLIAAHLEEVPPRRDRALPRLEALL